MKLRSLALILPLLVAVPAAADEGMWTFDNVPRAAIHARYGVDVDQAWLDRVRLSTVRLETGCSGSFISPEGLVITNHHCVEDALVEHSSPTRDLMANGYLAHDRGQELPCSNQQISVLVKMEDVTAQVRRVLAGLDEQRALEMRQRVLSQLEKQHEDLARQDPRIGGDVACEAVALYQGGQYMIYTYKRYVDVRLVFTPELAVSDFGGDPDNFQFPRWCFDVALVRVYENGHPAHTPNFLPVNFAGPKNGEPVFVSGHPATTDRLLTLDQLRLLRDVDLPQWLLRSAELRGRYLQFGKTGPEAAREVTDPIQGLENSLKVRRCELEALNDDSLMEAKAAAERELARRVAADPTLAAATGHPWLEIERATRVAHAIGTRRLWIEGEGRRSGLGFSCTLFGYARTLVRAAAERGKPSGQRLREFSDSQLPKLRQRFLAPEPIYPAMENLTLSFSFERMREMLGPDDPFVKKVLGKESPDSLAARLVRRSKLADPAVRRALWDGGAAALRASHDPMIELAQRVDPEARAIRKAFEDQVQAPIQQAQEKIASARFAVYGTHLYPDATFTLRLTYGAVRGWNENGTWVKPFTTVGTGFARATGEDPFAFPKSWTRTRLDPATPFNLCTDNDIVGGNSGSPLIDARGRLVGVIFDGNIRSIAGSYWFDPSNNRAVAVHPAILKEALEKVYGAPWLVKEMSSAPISAAGTGAGSTWGVAH